jgi:hypothetical protein
MLHLLQKATKTRLEIPAALWRLGFSSLLAQKNFDFAQDDMLGECLRYTFVFLCFFLTSHRGRKPSSLPHVVYFFIEMAFFAASAIFAGVSPYASRSAGTVPECP